MNAIQQALCSLLSDPRLPNGSAELASAQTERVLLAIIETLEDDWYRSYPIVQDAVMSLNE